MYPKGFYFGAQKLALETPNSSQHLYSLAYGIGSPFWLVSVSLGDRIWSHFGMHLGGTRPRKFSFLGSWADIKCFFDLRWSLGLILEGILKHFWPSWVAFSGFFERAILFVALCTFHVYTRYLAFYAFHV